MLTETSGRSGLRETTRVAPLDSELVVHEGTLSVGVLVGAGVLVRSTFVPCASREAVSVAERSSANCRFLTTFEMTECLMLFLQDVVAAVGSDRDFLAVGCGGGGLALGHDAEDHAARAEVRVGDALHVGGRDRLQLRVAAGVVRRIAVEDLPLEQRLGLAEI